MVTRRSFIGAAAGAALVAPFAGFTPASAQGEPSFRFGVLADPQYAPVPPAGTRYYAHSLWKLAEAVQDFNRENLSFVATLGDIIERDWQSFHQVLPLYDRLAAPRYFVLGNHDHAVAAERLGSVPRAVGLERSWYDFAGGGYRFLVIDGGDVSTFAHRPGSENHALAIERLARLAEAGAPNARQSNGGLSAEQFSWIEDTMAAARSAGERVVVQAHWPVYPKDGSNLWGDEELVDLLTSYDNFVLYLNGHNHAGNYGRIGRSHFVNLRGMVETPDSTAYAIVEVWDDRIQIHGRGRQESRTLAL